MRGGSWPRTKVISWHLGELCRGPVAALETLPVAHGLIFKVAEQAPLEKRRQEAAGSPTWAQQKLRGKKGSGKVTEGGQKGLFLPGPRGVHCGWCPDWKKTSRRLIIEMLLLLVFLNYLWVRLSLESSCL